MKVVVTKNGLLRVEVNEAKSNLIANRIITKNTAFGPYGGAKYKESIFNELPSIHIDKIKPYIYTVHIDNETYIIDPTNEHMLLDLTTDTCLAFCQENSRGNVYTMQIEDDIYFVAISNIEKDEHIILINTETHDMLWDGHVINV